MSIGMTEVEALLEVRWYYSLGRDCSTRSLKCKLNTLNAQLYAVISGAQGCRTVTVCMYRAASSEGSDNIQLTQTLRSTVTSAVSILMAGECNIPGMEWNAKVVRRVGLRKPSCSGCVKASWCSRSK